jgi:septum formation protein
METIILASGSPRRQELLNRVGIPFKAFPPNISEEFTGIRDVGERVRAIASKKVQAVLDMFKQESPRWVLGLDTLVELDGRAISKPSGIEEAERVLKLLSGKIHKVHTGIAFLPFRGEEMDLGNVCTEVKFARLQRDDIEMYLDSGEWSGVTGAYRIQERGAFFVEWIHGSYSNVVGLPLETFYGILKKNHYSLR